jgi:lysozyme
MTITAAEAERLLREDVAASEEAVRRQVVVRANRNQFSALVSLAYNLGSGGFSGTSVLSRLNSGDYAGVADAFLAYDRARVDGEMRTIPHLTERRNKERALFLS